LSDYKAKKALFEKMLTIYGRKPVLEALEDNSLEIYKLHLSKSNAPSKILDAILSAAKKRDIPVAYHDKKALSRISKNGRQDQGVALDIHMPHFTDEEEFILKNKNYRLLVLDRITNPQNVGMIVRSAAAGNIDALVIPQKGTAKLDALVVKASAGTLFRMPIIRTDDLVRTLKRFKKDGAELFALDADAKDYYDKITYPPKTLFVLGNETEGVSESVRALCDRSIAIAMRRGVESLNVAVTAALLAFSD
jgi:23S rRNA (guanosine2251-2'-O)-methyltransferase